MEQIPTSQIAYKKKIGTLTDNGSDVIEIGLRGGLVLVVSPNKGKVNTLGVGSHRRIARTIAMKSNKDLKFNDLEKSEEYDPANLEDLIEKYQELSDQFRNF